MTRLDAFDQQLESWLEAEADFPVPASLQERVLEPATRRRPRPAVLARGDGSDPRPVTHADPLTGIGSFPKWSPDDTQIAYMVGLSDGGLHLELRVVDLRTGIDRPVV